MTEKNRRLGIQVPIRIGRPPNDRDALAHIPPPLPLVPPPDLTSMLMLLEQASIALGGLNALSRSWNKKRLNSLLRVYAQLEATFSSQIDGAQTSLVDLLLFESRRADSTNAATNQADNLFGTRRDELREMMNYRRALRHGLRQLRLSDGLPLCLRFLCELHKRLLQGSVRGANKVPGEFRRVQNYIGGSEGVSYVPPPVEWMNACLDNFDHQLNDTSSGLPLLVQAAILHAQFEAIHPFMDGNGRVGRLLIGLFLFQHKILDEPSLYLSWYFKQHRTEYYDRLHGIQWAGGWEAWIAFFLEGVRATALDARTRAEKLHALYTRDRRRLMKNTRATKTTLAVYEILTEGRMVWAASLARKLECTPPPVYKALSILEEMDIVREYTTQKRNRVFVYQKYMDILAEDTEPLPRGVPAPRSVPAPPRAPRTAPPPFPSRRPREPTR